MCGVAGIISERDRRQDLMTMLDELTHRGPDQRGVHISAPVHLGSQRLKMSDLSDAGALPMRDMEAGLTLSFNGEISNHRELREILSKKYQFRSKSDTEVFLKLYREHGIEGLRLLSGMFAFILHDEKLGRVYFGRDFFGINPLFYYRKNEDLYVASELKALVPFLPSTPELNVQAIYDLFTLAYIPGTSTPYSEVHEVGPGSFFCIDLLSRTLSSERYFQFSYQEKDWSEREAIEATREVLIDSTRRHLDSDSPIGTFLSGGIDTSSLVGIAKHLGLSENLHTFSIRIDDKFFDESRYQKVMVDFARTQHHEIRVGLPEIIEGFETHLAFMDEPYGHGAALPTFLLAREASGFVKGLLSGEGGDELFNAYETHGAHYWKKIYRKLPSGIRSAVRNTVNALPVTYEKLSLDFKLKRFCAGAELSTAESHLYWRHVLSDEAKKNFFVSEHLPTTRISESFFLEISHLDDFSQLSSWDVEHFFFGDLMVKNDRMSLAHSVESRFPYMDRAVTDLVSTIPSTLRMKGSRRRHLQKEAMKPFLPEVIYRRDGFGLELPYNRWFLGELAPLYGKYFTREKFEHFPFLSWETFQDIFGRHQSRCIDAGRFLWTTLILIAWYDITHVSKSAPELRRRASAKRS